MATEPLEEEQIERLLPSAIKGSIEAQQELVLGHLSMLRHTVGRYLYHWPLTRRFQEEMVSAGLHAMTRAVNRLKEDTLENQSLGRYLLNHICKRIEIEIARLRGICPAPTRTNQRRIKNGEGPIFGEIEADVHTPSFVEGYFYIEEGFEEYDIRDALDKIKEQSHKCELLLSEECWGLNDTEASKLTGIPRQTVQWYRSEMLKRYQELIGD
jgi:hypothetical protein